MSAEDFSRHIARVVASQVAEATGFDACQDSAIEILGDLLLRYLTTVSAGCHSYAELAGRSQSNLSDVLLALEDLGVTPEDLHQHMQLQGTDVPFAHTLVQYPVHRQQPLPPTFGDQKDEPPGGHIPPFLPAFPDPHTYQHTAAYAGHQTDPHKQRQSMLEAKQKSEAALHKLHQRISSKSHQPDTNPFLAAPAVEQLPLQLPALPAAAAAAAAAAAGGGVAADGPAGAAAAAAAAGASASAAGAANGSGVNGRSPAAVADGGGGGGLESQAGDGQQQQQQWQQQQQPSLLFLQQQQRLAAAAAAAAAAGDDLDEDMLFESAAVLKAFASILPPELLAQHAARLQGGSSSSDGGGGEQGAPAQGKRRGRGRGLSGAGGGGGAAAANGGLVDDADLLIEDEEATAMDVDGAGGGAAGGGDGAAGDPSQAWLAWDGQQQQQGQQQQRPADLLGPAGVAGSELLRFGVDPLAVGKGTAVRLAGAARPPDAFAERAAAAGRAGGGAGVSGSGRQRRSRYDADPKQQKAEGILNASPEAVYATGGGGEAGGRHAAYGGGNIYTDLGEDVV